MDGQIPGQESLVGAGALAVIALGFLAFGLTSRSVRSSFLTGPLLFTAFGLLVGAGGLGLVPLNPSHEWVHLMAEVTLVLVLFTDASSINLAKLRSDPALPVRLLLVGMPLTVVATAFAAWFVFPTLSFPEVALLAALLAPTDAALGQAVVASTRVPERIRTALSVESGLNDGIALPIVLLFASMAAAGASASAQAWTGFVIAQITLGPLVGMGVGTAAGKLVDTAAIKGWMSPHTEGITAIATALLAFASANLVGGNGFIAAFVAGLCFGAALGHKCTFLYEFAEEEGLLLTLATFFVLGSALLPEVLPHITPVYVLFGLASLTLLRMVPVAISLWRAGTDAGSVAFIGWFGPRGLATILFLLLIVGDLEMEGGEIVTTAALTTVLLSILLHGLTAAPLSRRFPKVKDDVVQR